LIFLNGQFSLQTHNATDQTCARTTGCVEYITKYIQLLTDYIIQNV